MYTHTLQPISVLPVNIVQIIGYNDTYLQIADSVQFSTYMRVI